MIETNDCIRKYSPGDMIRMLLRKYPSLYIPKTIFITVFCLAGMWLASSVPGGIEDIFLLFLAVTVAAAILETAAWMTMVDVVYWSRLHRCKVSFWPVLQELYFDNFPAYVILAMMAGVFF